MIVHIGCYKTGSSSIQGTLLFGREELLRHGVHFPAPKGGVAYKGETPGMQFFLSRHKPEELAEILTAEGDCIVLSNENMWDHSPIRPNVARVIELIDPEELVIVGYVRETGKFLRSWYAQRAKKPQPESLGRSPEAFIELHRKRGTFSLDNAFGLFERRFGAESILVRPYNRALFPGGDVVADFFSATGLPRPAAGSGEERNLSIDEDEAQLAAKMWDMALRVGKAAGLSPQEIIEGNHDFVRDAVRGAGVRFDAPVFTEAQVAALREEVGPPNARFLARHGVDPDSPS